MISKYIGRDIDAKYTKLQGDNIDEPYHIIEIEYKNFEVVLDEDHTVFHMDTSMGPLYFNYYGGKFILGERFGGNHTISSGEYGDGGHCTERDMIMMLRDNDVEMIRNRHLEPTIRRINYEENGGFKSGNLYVYTNDGLILRR